jgi:hypothetical protein
MQPVQGASKGDTRPSAMVLPLPPILVVGRPACPSARVKVLAVVMVDEIPRVPLYGTVGHSGTSGSRPAWSVPSKRDTWQLLLIGEARGWRSRDSLPASPVTSPIGRTCSTLLPAMRWLGTGRIGGARQWRCAGQPNSGPATPKRKRGDARSVFVTTWLLIHLRGRRFRASRRSRMAHGACTSRAAGGSARLGGLFCPP